MIGQEYVNTIVDALSKLEYDFENESSRDYSIIIAKLVEIFSIVKEGKKQVFFIGNGGSAAISSHMTADFMKNGGMNTCGLYDSAVTTCMGNDYGYEHVFDKPLSFLGQEGSLLVAISSSGNSKNIILAIDAAKKVGMKVLTLTGFKPDNKIRTMGDYNLYVPIEEYGKVESIHNLILQQVVDEILYRDGVTL